MPPSDMPPRPCSSEFERLTVTCDFDESPARHERRVRTASQPTSTGLELGPAQEAQRSRFLSYTFPSRSPGPAHPAVLNRPGFVEAAPTLPGSGCPQLHPTAAATRRWTVSHPHPKQQRLVARTNRRHMIGDHHGRTAGRATLPVRAVDGILGTHNLTNRPHAVADVGEVRERDVGQDHRRPLPRSSPAPPAGTSSSRPARRRCAPCGWPAPRIPARCRLSAHSARPARARRVLPGQRRLRTVVGR